MAWAHAAQPRLAQDDSITPQSTSRPRSQAWGHAPRIAEALTRLHPPPLKDTANAATLFTPHRLGQRTPSGREDCGGKSNWQPSGVTSRPALPAELLPPPCYCGAGGRGVGGWRGGQGGRVALCLRKGVAVVVVVTPGPSPQRGGLLKRFVHNGVTESHRSRRSGAK